jgi:hypothetical protein
MSEPKVRRKRRHSLRQLEARPITITSSGPVTIEAVSDAKLGLVVRVWHSHDAAVDQPPATAGLTSPGTLAYDSQ